MNNEYKTIIAKLSAIDIAEDELKEDMFLIEDLLFDSLSFVHMVLMIEKAYEINFDDEYINIEKHNTVKDVADYIKTKTSEA